MDELIVPSLEESGFMKIGADGKSIQRLELVVNTSENFKFNSEAFNDSIIEREEYSIENKGIMLVASLFTPKFYVNRPEEPPVPKETISEKLMSRIFREGSPPELTDEEKEKRALDKLRAPLYEALLESDQFGIKTRKEFYPFSIGYTMNFKFKFFSTYYSDVACEVQTNFNFYGKLS